MQVDKHMDDFLQGRTAIVVSRKIPYDELIEFQNLLEGYAGRQIAWTAFTDGFAEYCDKIRSYVFDTRDIDEIYVVYSEDGDIFGFEPGGSSYFEERGVDLVPFRGCLYQLRRFMNDVKEVDKDEFALMLEYAG